MKKFQIGLVILSLIYSTLGWALESRLVAPSFDVLNFALESRGGLQGPLKGRYPLSSYLSPSEQDPALALDTWLAETLTKILASHQVTILEVANFLGAVARDLEGDGHELNALLETEPTVRPGLKLLLNRLLEGDAFRQIETGARTSERQVNLVGRKYAEPLGPIMARLSADLTTHATDLRRHERLAAAARLTVPAAFIGVAGYSVASVLDSSLLTGLVTGVIGGLAVGACAKLLSGAKDVPLDAPDRFAKP